MTYAAFEDQRNPGDWRVESEPYNDGVIDVAIFTGLDADKRAVQYALFKNGEHRLTQPYFDILDERDRQDAKWGDQSHRTDGTSRVFESARDRARMECDQAEQQKATTGGATWRHILREETLEAFAETDGVKLRTELVQSAAVIVAWIESIDKREAK